MIFLRIKKKKFWVKKIFQDGFCLAFYLVIEKVDLTIFENVPWPSKLP